MLAVRAGGQSPVAAPHTDHPQCLLTTNRPGKLGGLRSTLHTTKELFCCPFGCVGHLIVWAVLAPPWLPLDYPQPHRPGHTPGRCSLSLETPYTLASSRSSRPEMVIPT